MEEKLHDLSKEKSRLNDDMKQLIRDESMGREVIQETAAEIHRNQASLDKQSILWREAKNRLTNYVDNEELRKDENTKRKQKYIILEKVESMRAIIEKEKKKSWRIKEKG